MVGVISRKMENPCIREETEPIFTSKCSIEPFRYVEQRFFVVSPREGWSHISQVREAAVQYPVVERICVRCLVDLAPSFILLGWNGIEVANDNVRIFPVAVGFSHLCPEFRAISFVWWAVAANQVPCRLPLEGMNVCLDNVL